MRIIGIIQARMNSTRLPGKVLFPLNGKPALGNIIDRVKQSRLLTDFVIATSKEESDRPIWEYCESEKANYFKGSLNNVLERYYICAKKYDADIIVRMTGDNVLIDSMIIDEGITYFIDKYLDYDYMKYKNKLPLGMAVEIFSFDSLEKTYLETMDSECMEHVTLYMYMNPSKFKSLFYEDVNERNYSQIRLTMDTQEDYHLMDKIYRFFGRNDFTYDEMIKAYLQHPEWEKINIKVTQNSIKYRGYHT